MSQPLRDRLAANARRLRRREAAAGLSAYAVAVAAACDRFALHCCDPRHDALKRRMSEAAARAPDAKCVLGSTVGRAELRDLVARHGLGGWCLVFAGFGSSRTEIAVGVDASELADVVAALQDAFPADFDDAWMACEAGGWCVLLDHDGGFSLWRDV